MENLKIRRAAESDMEVINKLLYQVLKVHSDARPDLFKAGTKKYGDEELKAIIADDHRPIFVAEKDGTVLGYAFCVHQQYIDNNNMTVFRHNSMEICNCNCFIKNTISFRMQKHGNPRWIFFYK